MTDEHPATYFRHAPYLLLLAGATLFNVTAGTPLALGDIRDVLPDRALTLPLGSAFAALWLGYLCVALGTRRPSPRAVALYSSIVVLLFLLTPVTLSTDVLDYIRRGRILSLHGANPHVVPFSQFPDDPFQSDVGWTFLPTPYGPLFTLLSGGLTWLAGDGRLWNILLFKLACTAAHLLNFLLVRRITGSERAGLSYLLNPFVLLEVVANAHNDVLPLSAVLLSLRALQTGAALRSGALLAAAACFKIPFVCLLPVWFRYLAWPDDRDRHSSRRTALLGTVAAALVIAALWIPFYSGPAVLGVYRFHAATQTKWSTPALLRQGLAAADLPDAAAAAGAICAAAAAMIAAPVLWRAGQWPLYLRAVATVTLLLPLVGMGWLLPWYFVWPLGVMPLLSDRAWTAAAVALTGAGLGHYAQQTWLGFVSSFGENLVLGTTSIAPPLLILLGAAILATIRRARS